MVNLTCTEKRYCGHIYHHQLQPTLPDVCIDGLEFEFMRQYPVHGCFWRWLPQVSPLSCLERRHSPCPQKMHTDCHHQLLQGTNDEVCS